MANSVANIDANIDFSISHYGNEQIEQRMLSMGILPNAKIRVIRKSPFGSNFYLKINNLSVAVRKEEAANIFVQ